MVKRRDGTPAYTQARQEAPHQQPQFDLSFALTFFKSQKRGGGEQTRREGPKYQNRSLTVLMASGRSSLVSVNSVCIVNAFKFRTREIKSG